MSTFIMMLNDGETWTNLENCAIVEVQGDDMESIEQELAASRSVPFPEAENFIAYFDMDERGILMIHNRRSVNPRITHVYADG